MRHVFVIGDSISIQYGPYLKDMLADRYGYDRKSGEEAALTNLDRPMGANGGDSSMVLEYLTLEHNQGTRYDILLINCGLHDIKSSLTDGSKQVPPDDYRNNLQSIAKLAQKMANDVIWIRTTDVVTEIHNARCKSFQRFGEDVLQYNRVADQVWESFDIPRMDLYSFSRTFGTSAYCDHVHFTEEVRRLQAAYIAGYLDSRF
ncbi:SGNH/GDSL hydrolase family protein [Paenibacillus sp. UNC451MF]|uniref:SGNH/GDSL hydrolase family protein n=1 Tax=Paenibacillus sp. UNC451MF TaxID=1449063 RepID=UPI00055EFAB4|nr:SGNH/GDSL hydrolase family protein [Paenibacillus sp. UNC451MF]